ncbi:MAG: ChaN family lipoprotein [Phycisphaerales bacterium]
MRTLILLALVLLPACAAPPRAAAPPADPRSVVAVDGRTGAAVGWEELVSAASECEALIIGENHGHPLGLAGAAALFDDVLGRADGAVLSMEFFERDEQPRLDDYLAGLTDERTFRQRTRRTASSYPDGHRQMVEAAKRAGRPVIAANAPRPYVTAARKESYERLLALTPEQRRLFRVPDVLPEGRYAEDFRRIMSRDEGTDGEAHGEPDEDERARLDAMFRSQSLWDWTMAESIARAAADCRPVVHVVGRFHSDFGGGLVQALERLRPGVRVVTVSVVDEWSGSLREEDRGRADFVVYVGPSREPAGR